MTTGFHPRYLAPNLVTATGLCLSVAAMLLAHAGRYEDALWFLVASVLLDRVDGVVARLLRATSAFGEQFDSLADMVAFCVAPPFVLWCLLTGDARYAPAFADPAPRVALALSMAAYLLGGAFRLARFNVDVGSIGQGWFRGLPTPIAAGILCTFVLAAWELGAPAFLVQAVPLLLAACAVLMVSTLWLPKSAGVGRGVLVPMAVLIYGLGFARQFPTVLLLASVAYPAVGFALAPRIRRRRGLACADPEKEGSTP